jgi:carbamoyltransferase
VLQESAPEYFDLTAESPYMLMVAPVTEQIRVDTRSERRHEDLLGWVNQVRSSLPAITHVDYSARIQTVTRERNGSYYDIIRAFKELTGVGAVVNTSFNVRGEPIVCTPEDAYRCFMRTQMDYLVLEHHLIDRSAQPKLPEDDSWKQTFQLD